MMTPTTKIYLGADHAGLDLKLQLIEWLRRERSELVLEDLGTFDTKSVDYPVYGKKVAEAVVGDPGSLGILICGSGIGMSMAANRVLGARAAVVSNATSARLSKAHNNANILCLGGRVVGREVAFDCVRAWLTSTFEGERHQARIDLLDRVR